MEKIKDIIKTLLKKGFASEEEVKDLISECSKFEDKQLSEIKNDLEKVTSLPFEKPVQLDDTKKTDEKKNGKKVEKTREERRKEARAKHGK